MGNNIIDKSFKKTLGEEVTAGRVTKNTFGDLSVYCYSRKTEYENLWNEFNTLIRGLVTSQEGKIVSACMPKFFNFGQLDEKTQKKLINEKDFTVYEKLDGSLIHVSKYEGELIVTSKKSFQSEQALKAKELIRKKYNKAKFSTGYTYVFEIIYPENKIVVDYGNKEELVLLTIIDNKTMLDIDEEKINLYAEKFNFRRPKKYNYTSIRELLKEQAKAEFTNEEGFVVQLRDGYRFKIKYSEYFKLHKIITEYSLKSVIEFLMNGSSVTEFIKEYNIPDEFFNEVKFDEDGIKELYSRIEEDNLKIASMVRDLPTRKEQALKLFEIEGKDSVSEFNKGIVFLMLDDKKYSDAIWKIILKQIKDE